MVLTNIELWAADASSGSSMPLNFDSNNPHARHINPFDPRVVPQINSNLNHLSSNGYYGFSYVNAAHNIEMNNNNNNNISHINNNNNTTACNLLANDVSGMNNATATLQQTHSLSANFDSTAYAASHAVNVARCKKRFFVMNDDNDVFSDCTSTKNKNYYDNSSEVSAKRCRFDDDYSAQYCNDFFQLPSTQIATQSCLMDTEEGLQPQQQQYPQQQVDMAMFENNNNNIEKYEQKLNPQLSAHEHEQHSQQTQQQQHEPQQQHLYHQQQHYQDIPFATIKCHLNPNNNNNSDILALNNHTSKIELQKNTENFVRIHTPNRNSSIGIENKKYNNDVANDLKVDDATFFAQLHGGCLHHHKKHFNCTDNSLLGDLIAKKDAMHNNHLQDDNYFEEF